MFVRLLFTQYLQKLMLAASCSTPGEEAVWQPVATGYFCRHEDDLQLNTLEFTAEQEIISQLHNLQRMPPTLMSTLLR